MYKDDVLQNLKDAGCDSLTADKIFTLIESGDRINALNLLGKQRIQLLNLLHENQKKIDYLDFLIFNLTQKI